MSPRDSRGRFIKQRGWYLNEKGYPRFSSGPNRGRYVHRVMMEKHLGRELAKDEDVHHVDADKKNFRVTNLQVLGHREHGCVSALQHWYVKAHDIQLEAEWNDYFSEQENNEELRAV